MLDYDEITQLVIKMRDEEIAKDRRRKTIIKRSAAAALTACAAGVILLVNHNHVPLDPHNGTDAGLPDTAAPVTTAVPENVSASDTAPAETADKGNKTRTTAAAETAFSPSESSPAANTGTEAAASRPAAQINSTAKPSGANISNVTRAAVNTAAIQTAAETAPVVTTTINNDEDERSIDMKKLLSFAASIVFLANVAEIPGQATESDIGRTDVTREDLAIFEEMDSGYFDTDINMDGVFDIKDTFTLFAYDYDYGVDPDVAEHIRATADFDSNGSIGSGDSRVLLKYFIEKMMFRREHLEESFYEDFDIIRTVQGEPIYGSLHPEIEALLNSEDYDKGAYTWEEFDEMCKLADEQGIIGYEEREEKFSEIFLRYLRTFLNDRGGYQVFKQCVDEEIIDFDINSDGTITLDDINTYWYFLNQKPIKESRERNHQWVDSLLPIDADPEGLLALRDPDFETSIPDDQWAKCEDVYNFFSTELGLYETEMSAVEYIIRRDGKPEDKYFDNAYYEGILSGSGEVRLGNTVDYMYCKVYPVDDKMVVVDYSSYSDILNDYCNRVYNGEIVPDDADGNGVIDVDDALASYVYFNDYRHGITKEESYLPEAAWDFFENELDLDGNGICGEYADLDIYDIGVYAYFYYIEKVTGERLISDSTQESSMTPLDEYISRLKAAKEGTDTVSADFITNEDVSVLASGASVLSGDANCDGKLNIADSVSVLQYISNSEKYSMTALGKINADIDGERGLTGSDAIEIQKIDAGIK